MLATFQNLSKTWHEVHLMYLSSIQHKNLIPRKFMADWGASIVKWTKTGLQYTKAMIFLVKLL